MQPPRPTRRMLLQAIAAGGAATMMQKLLAAGSNPAAVGMKRIRGNVMVNDRPAHTGLLVRPGDTVVTGPDAEAVYIIGQDAFLQREDTTVRFGTDAAKDFMRLITGKVLSVFGRGDKRLVVGTATIGIRGTACYIEEEGSRTYFCLCYGEAEVLPNGNPAAAETLRTTRHDRPIYIQGNSEGRKALVPAKVINHTDVELTLLESLVGRVPPYGPVRY